MARWIEAVVAHAVPVAELETWPEDLRKLYVAGIATYNTALKTPFRHLFPEEDFTLPNGEIIYSRSKYPKQMEFFEAGKLFMERALMAANRVGKTVAGSYEVTAHLTGEYPDWWNGRRFNHPISVWAAGKVNETTRDIVQRQLLGDVEHRPAGRKGVTGAGMIPPEMIVQDSIAWKQGVADLVDKVHIRNLHDPKKHSILGFKSYQQGRGSFEGTAQHVIWLDEEAPKDVYDECLIRLTTTKGVLMLTFTPLEGLSETALAFLPADQRPAAA